MLGKPRPKGRADRGDDGKQDRRPSLHQSAFRKTEQGKQRGDAGVIGLSGGACTPIMASPRPRLCPVAVVGRCRNNGKTSPILPIVRTHQPRIGQVRQHNPHRPALALRPRHHPWAGPVHRRPHERRPPCIPPEEVVRSPGSRGISPFYGPGPMPQLPLGPATLPARPGSSAPSQTAGTSAGGTPPPQRPSAHPQSRRAPPHNCTIPPAIPAASRQAPGTPRPITHPAPSRKPPRHRRCTGAPS
jgi:hypothetical protein